MGEDEVSSMRKNASRIYTGDMKGLSLLGSAQNMDHRCTMAFKKCISFTEAFIEKRRAQNYSISSIQRRTSRRRKVSCASGRSNERRLLKTTILSFSCPR